MRVQRLKVDDQMCLPAIFSVMTQCWKFDPSMRITAETAALELDVIGERQLAWPALKDLKSAAQAINTATDIPAAYGPIDIKSQDNVARFKQLEIEISSIKILRELGSGAFGAVHLGMWTSSDQASRRVAIKTVTDVSDDNIVKFITECKLLAAIRHENVVELVAVVTQNPSPMMVLELMGPDLAKFLRQSAAKGETIDMPAKVSVCLQVSNAMTFLSRCRVVHRDLAARNVLVSLEGIERVKINDLGLSRTLQDSPYYRKNSNDRVPIKWMAPESIVDRVYSSASDIWSYGVLCWEVFSMGAKPYSGMTADATIIAVFKGMRLEQPIDCPSSM